LGALRVNVDELMRLRKATKGRKSEKLDPRQLQLLLSLVGENDWPAADANETREQFDDRLDGELDGLSDEELEQAEQSDGDTDSSDGEEATEGSNDGSGKKRRGGRRPPPEHLQIETRIIEPDLSGYEDREMVCIGSVDAHTLDWRPGHFEFE